jgi:hypothetical protein
VLDEPDIRRRLTEQGGDVQPESPEAMTKRVATDIEKWKRIVEARKIELQ